jgi:hypothetical protein
MSGEQQPMRASDPVSESARAAARRLAAELEPRIALDVEGALQRRELARRPEQYFDPISLAGLIVSVAALAWNVYTDLRKRTAQPSPEVLARTVRVQLRSPDATDPEQRDRIIEVVVGETIRVAAQPGDPPAQDGAPTPPCA